MNASLLHLNVLIFIYFLDLFSSGEALCMGESAVAPYLNIGGFAQSNSLISKQAKNNLIQAQSNHYKDAFENSFSFPTPHLSASRPMKTFSNAINRDFNVDAVRALTSLGSVSFNGVFPLFPFPNSFAQPVFQANSLPLFPAPQFFMNPFNTDAISNTIAPSNNNFSKSKSDGADLNLNKLLYASKLATAHQQIPKLFAENNKRV